MTLYRIKLIELNCSKLIKVFTVPFQADNIFLYLFNILLKLIILYYIIKYKYSDPKILIFIKNDFKYTLIGFLKQPKKYIICVLMNVFYNILWIKYQNLITNKSYFTQKF